MNSSSSPIARNCRTTWRVAGTGLAAVWLAFSAVATETEVPPAPSAPAESASRAAELKRLSLEELMAVEVATVTTASKKAEKVTDAPATVIVITATDIKLRGYSTLVDVLRDLPGMETIPYTFSELGTQVPVRGIVGNNKIIVLVNGMRVNPPGGEDFPFRSDFSVRDAEQIEVIYGPGSTLYGQDAISCVINVKTKRPLTGDHGEVGADGGLHDEREAWGTFGGVLNKDQNILLSGLAQYHDSDLSRIDKEYPAWWAPQKVAALGAGSGAVPWREDFGLNLFTRLDLFDNTSVQVWYRDSERCSSESGYPGAYIPKAVWGDSSLVVEGRNTVALTGTLKLESAVSYNRYEIDPATRYVWINQPITNQWFLNDYKYGIGQGATAEETLHWEATDRLNFLGGFEVGMFDVIPKSTVHGGADPDGDVIAQAGNFLYVAHGVTNYIPCVVRTTYQTYAGYIEANWRMLDQLRLIAGTRVTGDTRIKDTPITPRASLVWDATHELAVKYIYTRAFVAPSPYSANATYDNGTLLATSNPNLKPETSETHEINLTYNKKNFTLGTSVYYGTQDHLIITSDSYSSTFTVNGLGVVSVPGGTRELVHTVNGGSSTRYGADFYGRATFGPVSPWWSYSYVDFQQTTAGLTTGLEGISRHNGRLGVTWAVTPKLFVTPSLEIRSTPENVSDPYGALKSQLTTPYDVNLYLLWNATKHIDVFLSVRNLTDNHYALAGFANGYQAIPQETISGVFGVRINY